MESATDATGPKSLSFLLCSKSISFLIYKIFIQFIQCYYIIVELRHRRAVERGEVCFFFGALNSLSSPYQDVLGLEFISKPGFSFSQSPYDVLLVFSLVLDFLSSF